MSVNEFTYQKAFMTVLSSDDFLPGVIILYLSLKKHSKYPLVVLCSDNLAESCYETLKKCGIKFFVQKNCILPDEIVRAEADERKKKFGDWQNTFFKLNMFAATHFEKVCYLDCDMIVNGTIDSLFDYPDFSAVPDAAFYQKESNGLNSGLIVFKPRENNTTAFQKTIIELWNNGPWPFGDQDVLSAMQPEWHTMHSKHIPVNFNACVGRLSTYGNDLGHIYIYHYANHWKPWNMKYGYFLRIVRSIIHLQWKTVKALLIAKLYIQKAKRYIKD